MAVYFCKFCMLSDTQDVTKAFEFVLGVWQCH